MTVVYLDRVAVLNLLVDYLLLLATATLAGTPLRRLRFGVCAALGALCAVLVFICRPLAHPLYRAAVGVVLARWAFHREVRPWRLTALFWLLSAGLAGVLLALGLLAGSPTGVLQRIYYADIRWMVLLGAAAVFYGLLHFVFRQGARHERGELMEVNVVIGSRQCRLRALRDNGNTLRDPLFGQPVMVAETEAMKQLWPGTVAAILHKDVPAEEKMALLHEAGAGLPFMLLPFRAVGTTGGLLLACRSDYIQIGGERIAHALVALTDTQVGIGGYQALWGGREGSYDTVESYYTVDPAADQTR